MRTRLVLTLCLGVAVTCTLASPHPTVSAQSKPAGAGDTFLGRKTRQGTFQPRGDEVLELYDVRDLLVARGGFPMRPFNAEQTEEAPLPADLGVDVFLEDLRSRLHRAGVQRNVYVLSAIATNTNAFNRREIMTMKAAPAVQAKLKEILNELRARRSLLFTIEAHIYRIADPHGPLPMLLANEVLGEEETVFVLDDGQARTLRKELKEMAKRKKSNVQIINAPRITLFESSRGNVMIVDQQAYIADYRTVKVLGKPDMILDPVVKTLQTGMGLDVRIVQLENERSCRVEAAYQRAELRKPIGTKKTRHGEIQTPVIDITNVRTTSTVELPGWMLISTRKQSRLGTDLILLRIAGGAAGQKQRAKVIGVGPVSGAVKTLFVDTKGTTDLVVGTTVQVFGHASKQTVLSTGTVDRVVEKLAIVTLERAIERTAKASWWCTWTPSKRGRRAR